MKAGMDGTSLGMVRLSLILQGDSLRGRQSLGTGFSTCPGLILGEGFHCISFPLEKGLEDFLSLALFFFSSKAGRLTAQSQYR